MKTKLLSALALAATMLVASTANAETALLASWYGPGFHGKLMANGRVFDQNDPTTVAHKSLPFCTQLRVRGPNGTTKTLVVRDRGPYHGNRQLDVSKAAAQQLGFQGAGEARLEIIEQIPPVRKHKYGDSCSRYT